MEIKGRFSREGSSWCYSCDYFKGYGHTPEQAYRDYLTKFNYHLPKVPVSSEVNLEADHGRIFG
jgi:hypothetical protein